MFGGCFDSFGIILFGKKRIQENRIQSNQPLPFLSFTRFTRNYYYP